jgi:PAS domain S-box-containing protein
MTIPLRLLLIEDSADDAALLVRDLKRGDYDVTFERVSSKPDLEGALSRESWDLIISDYSMPGFNGREALDIVRQRQLDTPFIFVSGTIGEDSAVDAMRAGAQDYLMKGQARRLLPAVARELEEARRRNEQRRTAEDLRSTGEMLRAMFRASPLAVVATDLEGIVRSWNPAAERLFGWEASDAVGSPLLALSGEKGPETETLLARAMSGGLSMGFETQRRRRDGTQIDVSISVATMNNRAGEPDGFMVIYQDITARTALEAEVRQAQKMEVVGRLAAGVAHDFNNLLTVIASYSDFLLADLATDSPLREDIQQIQGAAASATTLTKQLLVFSRQKVLQPRVVAINSVVEGVSKLLARGIGPDIQLQTDFDPRAGSVMADPTQLEQVIMNLAFNARDAMPRGGTLTIETHGSVRRATPTHVEPLTHPRWHSLVVVRDTGTGMDEQTKGRIFEPFFTTKEAGKGTGLGLATAYGIVQQYDGVIRVESELGRGTSFKIYLPQTDQPTELSEPRGPGSTRGSETVLIVGDDPNVRIVTRQILERAGYTVLEASDGPTALHLAAKHAAPIDLLLADSNLRGERASDLAKRVAAAGRQTRVLFISGGADGGSGGADERDAISKPFTSSALTRKVRELLDSLPNQTTN